MEIEWDPAKARSNRKKHGVSFSDVEPVFYDEVALSMPDRFSVAEERLLVIGRGAMDRIITESFTYRGDDIRIISARLATSTETKEYEKGVRL